MNAPDLGAAGMRRLHDVVMRINSPAGLDDTLQAVVEGVRELAGFEAAAIRLVAPDGWLDVVAVSGTQAVSEAMLGVRVRRVVLDAELALGERWGSLVFVPHEVLPPGGGIPGWVSDEEPTGLEGAWHPLDALYAPLCSPAGDLLGVLSVDLPVDRVRPDGGRRQLLEMFAAHAAIAVHSVLNVEETRRSEEMLRLAFDGAGKGMALVALRGGQAGQLVRVNPALGAMLGYTEEELLARRVEDLVHPQDFAADLAAIEGFVDGSTRSFVSQRRFRHADGHDVWVESVARAIDETRGKPRFVVLIVQDIEERRTAEAELERRASHDALTGLPNRDGLAARLEGAALAARTSGREGAVLFCDLDDFKPVNDTHGHAVGDRVLQVVARRIAGLVRAADTVFRFGGDEFVVVADDLTPQAADELADRLTAAAARPIRVGDLSVTVSASTGAARIGVEVSDVTAVLARADRAMYAAKGG